ncbi:MAG: UDP-N-acetylmuramoyl-L-alanyl-D-glutamate--2,6-diaminopimelate ligase [Burkholderiales bacterium PBB6]|nr:MAG: UDP-N-acetylmuramoyl-L-alanyl-D-glutamate--2,6-diaminopimelate ligase [Burkholderiales bacterium PBB6]
MPLTRLKSSDAAARWLTSWVTGALRTDSRQVQPGDAFIAWPGYGTDGRRFVQAALAAGAATCLVEDDGVGEFGFEDARIATLPGLKAATGRIADAYYAHPSQALRVVATTGTNGKTSTAWWVAQAMSELGQRCGVVGTLGVGEPPRPGITEGNIRYTGLTTPDPVVLQAGLRGMLDQGFKACAMEASSIGIVEQRLVGTQIDVALFTNFTQDHLDYHGSMDAYWAAKRELFAWPGLKSAVINVDDPQGAALVGELAGKGLDLWTVSVNDEARLRAVNVGYRHGGLAFSVMEGTVEAAIETGLIGDYNVSNLLVVIGGLRALGVPLLEAVQAAAGVTPVPGRMQRVADTAAGPEVVVDYAHTPDALEKALRALVPLAASRGGRLWCVFGCGGDRDNTKRPLMGGIAARLAQQVVITSDNPRTEAPEQILAQLAAGVPADAAAHVSQQVDRQLAIHQSVAAAEARDVILVAGKGHEDYQEVQGVRHPFSDVTEALAALQARGVQ